MPGANAGMRLDPVTLEIVGTKLAAVTEEMGYALQRSGRTLYVKETADFGTALADRRGKFFAYPRQIGVSGFIDLDCRPTIEAVGDLEPGDVVITNHPYESGGLCTHTPDIHLIKPYFHGGEIVCYGWSFVHCSDIGGRVPSSISPSSQELFQEGFLMPPIKLMKRGVMNADLIRLLRANCRTPDENAGDIKAMLAALNVGERRVREIIDQHGPDVFADAQSDLRAYSAAKAREAFRAIPDGSYAFWDYLDDELTSPIPIRIRGTISTRAGEITLDFDGTDPQVAAAFNVPTRGKRHSWLSLRLASFALTRDPSIALNAGLFDPISVRSPAGSLVNPDFPAAVGVRHASTGRILDVLNGALAQALPEFMPACSGGVIIPVVLAETDAGSGRRNVIVVEPMVGGMGARFGADGVDGRDSSTANLANNPLESVEASARIRIHEYALRPDSGGPGQWRGGCGLAITFSVDGDEAQVLGRGMDRFRFAPWGLAGGKAGATARTVLNLGRPGERELGKLDVVDLVRGDTLTVLTPGGGGYGNPLERSVDLVVRDVQRGLVGAESAQRDYAVVIRDGVADVEATDALRRRRQSAGTLDEYTVVGSATFELGTHRRAWESAFDDELVARIHRGLAALPPAARRAARRRVYAPVLPLLAAGTLDRAAVAAKRAEVEAIVDGLAGDRPSTPRSAQPAAP